MSDEDREVLTLVDKMRQIFEERIESTEVVVASLTKAFVEVSAAVEAIAERMLEPHSEEEKAQFRAEIKKRHVEQLQMMEKLGREMDRSDSPDPSASVLKMVRKHDINDQREPYGSDGMQEPDPTGDSSNS